MNNVVPTKAILSANSSQRNGDSSPPSVLAPRFDTIPIEIKRRDQWFGWSWKHQPKQKKKWTKPPYSLKTGGTGSTTRRETWSTFQHFLDLYEDIGLPAGGNICGPGYRLDGDEVGIDLDGCRDPETGRIDQWAMDLVVLVNSYTELSPTGTGLRILAYGELPGGRWRTGNDHPHGIEMYDKNSPRYVTITGHHVDGTPTTIQWRNDELQVLHTNVFAEDCKTIIGSEAGFQLDQDDESQIVVTGDDQDIVDLASKHLGDRFTRLWKGRWEGDYPSGSEADMALAGMLAFYTGPDQERLEALMRESGLIRDKWDTHASYLDGTIAKALDGREDFFNWSAHLRGEDREWQLRAEERVHDIVGIGTSQSPASENIAADDRTTLDALMQVTLTKLDIDPSEIAIHDPSERELLSRNYRFAPISAADFAVATYTRKWLIKSVLVRDQPAIVGGPKKSLKTSILCDLVTSLGTGTHFLSQFETEKTNCVFISGESGQATIQETYLRICKAKKIDPKSSSLGFDFRLPRLSIREEVEELTQGVADQQYEVAVIDPLYLCLLSGTDKQAQNLFDMGPLLLDIANALLSVGCTPILVHHARKNLNRPGQALELEDLSYGGTQEFARQWLLINRRRPYDPGTGEHQLWLSTGGSFGHGGLWGVDVSEGILSEDFNGRFWSARVLDKSELTAQKKEEREEKKQSQEDQYDKEFLDALISFKEPPAKTNLKGELGWGAEKFRRVFDRLNDKGTIKVVKAEYEGGNGAILTKMAVALVNNSNNSDEQQ